MKNKGFTLIELLAVIIILGILMLIAIPSVSNYINNSRKETYVSTVKEMIKAASTKVSSGDFDMYDTNTTYYIPTSLLQMENGEAKSPYGNFEEAYVVVTYDGEEYSYYFAGRDSANKGISEPTMDSVISINSIGDNVTSIDTEIGINGKEMIVVINEDGTTSSPTAAKLYTSGKIADSKELNKPICIRATSLHTETCERSSYYCTRKYAIGQTIEYGNYGTEGQLSSGDAFDCDVNGDGTYDPETERFYYVGEYYDPNLKTVNDKIVSLIYYKDYKNDNYQYNTENNSLLGPLEAMKHLPTINEWSNVELFRTNRQLLSTTSNSMLAGKQLPIIDYSGYAARLISYYEFSTYCYWFNYSYSDNLSNCIYLFENTNFSSEANTVSGLWTETPYYDDSVVFIDPLYIQARNYYVTLGTSYNTSHINSPSLYYGVRPVIEVRKSKIKY